MAQMMWEATALKFAGVPVIDLHGQRGKATIEVTQKRYREVVALGVIIGLGGAVCVPLTVQSVVQQRLLSQIQQQTTQVEKRVQSVTTSSVNIETESSQWKKFVGSQERREGWAAVSRALAASVPPGLFLEQVQIEIGQDKKEILMLRGTCEQMSALQNFVISLKRMPFFAKVSLLEANAFTDIGPQGYQFKIDAVGNGALAGRN